MAGLVVVWDWYIINRTQFSGFINEEFKSFPKNP